MQYDAFRQEFRRHILSLSHNRLKELSKELLAAIRARYGASHEPKAENVERGFTECELRRFFSMVHNPDHRRYFLFLAVLGLRVGELLALRGEDLEGDVLRIRSLKGSYCASLRLPDALLRLLPPCGPEEPLFPMSGPQLRRLFRQYRDAAGLNDVYLVSEPCGRAMSRNRRFRLSLHSFRHYAIQRVFSETKDSDLARRFARHRHLEATERYLRRSRRVEIEALMEQFAGARFNKVGMVA